MQKQNKTKQQSRINLVSKQNKLKKIENKKRPHSRQMALRKSSKK